MKIEKRMIALCICTLAIGLATVLPLAYFTPRTASAQTNPWFDADILYANVIPNQFDVSGDVVNVVVNFTFTPDAVNLKGADAKIEVFNFHIYTDKTSIANTTYCLALSGNLFDPKSPGGFRPAIQGCGPDLFNFADGTRLNITEVFGDTEGITSAVYSSSIAGLDTNYEGNPYFQEDYLEGRVSAFLSEENGEKSAQALTNLRNAQTLYVEVTRVMTITYHHQTNIDSSTSSITTILATSDVLSRIELTKTDFGFVSGSVPDFMLNNAMYTYTLPPSTPTSLQHQSQ